MSLNSRLESTKEEEEGRGRAFRRRELDLPLLAALLALRVLTGASSPFRFRQARVRASANKLISDKAFQNDSMKFTKFRFYQRNLPHDLVILVIVNHVW